MQRVRGGGSVRNAVRNVPRGITLLGDREKMYEVVPALERRRQR